MLRLLSFLVRILHKPNRLERVEQPLFFLQIPKNRLISLLLDLHSAKIDYVFNGKIDLSQFWLKK